MEILIIGLIAAFGAAYLVKNSVASNTVTGVGAGPTPVAPHLKPNAILLTDNEIAQMNLSIGFSTSDKAGFIREVPKMLANEQLIDTGTSLARQCGGSLQYQGAPL